MICPSTRLFTVTVLNAVTDPRPVRYTGMSPWRAGTATTGTARAAALGAAAASPRACACAAAMIRRRPARRGPGPSMPSDCRGGPSPGRSGVCSRSPSSKRSLRTSTVSKCSTPATVKISSAGGSDSCEVTNCGRAIPKVIAGARGGSESPRVELAAREDPSGARCLVGILPTPQRTRRTLGLYARSASSPSRALRTSSAPTTAIAVANPRGSHAPRASPHSRTTRKEGSPS